MHEVALVEAVVHHVPPRHKLAHDDGHERDRVLEARAVIDRLRVPMNDIQAQRNDDGGDWRKQLASVIEGHLNKIAAYR